MKGITKSCGCLRVERGNERKGKPLGFVLSGNGKARTITGHDVINLRYVGDERASNLTGEVPGLGSFVWSRRGRCKGPKTLDIDKTTV